MDSFREQYRAASYRPRARRESGCLAARFSQLVGLDGWLLLLPRDTEIGTARGERPAPGEGKVSRLHIALHGYLCTGGSPDEGPASGKRCNPRAYISSSLAAASISSGSRSTGPGRFAGAVEDAEAAMAFLRQPENAAKYGIDTRRILALSAAVVDWLQHQAAPGAAVKK
jgi:hypothetical protein